MTPADDPAELWDSCIEVGDEKWRLYDAYVTKKGAERAAGFIQGMGFKTEYRRSPKSPWPHRIYAEPKYWLR